MADKENCIGCRLEPAKNWEITCRECRIACTNGDMIYSHWQPKIASEGNEETWESKGRVHPIEEPKPETQDWESDYTDKFSPARNNITNTGVNFIDVREFIRNLIEKKDKEISELKEALNLILPLAKGYIADNNFGSNQKYINIAEALSKFEVREK